MSETLLDLAMDGMRQPLFTLAQPLLPANPAKSERAMPNAWQAVAMACRPAPHHRWRAGARLRLRLISWASPALSCGSDDSATTALVGNPVSRRQLADASAKAASALGLHNADIVMARLDRLALEAASVEALREYLLEPAKRVVRLLAGPCAPDAGTRLMVRQTGLLLVAVLSETGARLREADGATADILQALAEVDTSTALMRACCAGLSRRYPGLQPRLACWADSDGPGFAVRLGDTHAFLMASTMPKTAQSPEDANDCLDQIRTVRDPGRSAAASHGREQ